MKERKSLSVAKRLIILASVIAAVFAIINLFWLFGVKIPYNNYVSEMNRTEEVDGEVRYTLKVEEFSCRVKMPVYLQFQGFLKVSPSRGFTIRYDDAGKIVSKSEMLVELYAWPDVWGNYQYGVDFYDDTSRSKQVYIDKDINYIPYDEYDDEFNVDAQELIDEHYDEIKTMLGIARNLWKIKD